MKYQGVRFRTEIINREVPKDSGLKELKCWCRKFHRYNLAPPYKGGSYGNLSFRLENGKDHFIIRGSRIGLKDKLSDNCFGKVSSADLEERIVYAIGKREPSSESMLHYAIYRHCPLVNAVFHGHSEEILSKGKTIGIPETSKEEPYGTIALVHGILEILDNARFLIIKNHGFIALGETMQQAGELTLQILLKLKAAPCHK